MSMLLTCTSPPSARSMARSVNQSIQRGLAADKLGIPWVSPHGTLYVSDKVPINEVWMFSPDFTHIYKAVNLAVVDRRPLSGDFPVHLL